MTRRPGRTNEDRPRVLFVDHSGLPGGGQLGMRRYLLETEAIEAKVIQFAPGECFSALGDQGIEVETLDSKQRKWSVFAVAGRLWRSIRKDAPDITIANSLRAACVLALVPRSRSPRVYYMRDDLSPLRNSRLKLLFMKWIVLPRFDSYIANSEWTASTLPKRFARRGLTIAHPVSGVRVGSQAAEGPEHPLRVLSLSRLAEWKGIHILLEAAHLLEQRGIGNRMEIVIAGSSSHADPDYPARLRSTAAGLSTPVAFLGHVSDVDELLRTASCLVCPSITPEPFGQVLIQAMAASVPVVATSAGGPLEIIEDGLSGLLAEPGSAADLADRLEWLITNPRERRQMGLRGAHASERYSDKYTVPELDRAIGQILATSTS